MSPSYAEWHHPPVWAHQSSWARPSRRLHSTFATLVIISVFLVVYHFQGTYRATQSTSYDVPAHKTSRLIVPPLNTSSASTAATTTTASSSPATSTPSPSSIPKKIWQTWKSPAQDLDGDLQPHARTWTTQNPDYRYELLTDASAFAFIEDKFVNESRVVNVFNATTDMILRADMTRYLVLLAEGGVYSDIDTDCKKPIDRWIPRRMRGKVGLVIGVEYDCLGGDRWAGKLPVELVQWTFAAKPGHPVLRRVVDNALDQLEKHNGTAEGWNDVLGITGPRVWTESIYEALSHQLGREVTYHDVFNLTTPKLLGDVLIMNVNAFGSGQPHSNSLPSPNDQELVKHHFHGMQNWVPEHRAKEEEAKRLREEAEKAAKAKEDERRKKDEAEKKAKEEAAKKLREDAERTAREEEERRKAEAEARKRKEEEERREKEKIQAVMHSEEVKRMIDAAIADALASAKPAPDEVHEVGAPTVGDG